MALIEWSEELSVGVPALDEQHKHLVEIINRFEDARRRGKGSRIMEEIMNDLFGYTQEHFAFEEKWMKEAGYEKLAQHQSQHRQLLQKIERLQFEYSQAGRRITAEVSELFKYWLTSHILGNDKAYSPVRETEKVES